MNTVRDIVKLAGGPVAVARATSTTEKDVSVDAVFKWYRNGIPEPHWPVLMRLARVSVEDLYSANRSARKKRKAAVGNAHAAA